MARSISFGAGPHFCAGAWISKTLIAEVAIPMLLKKFQTLNYSQKWNILVGPLEVSEAILCETIKFKLES